MSLTVTSEVGARIERASPYDLLTLIAVAGLITFAGWLSLSTLLNHDSGWYLHATKDWLAGGRLYVDIVEVNPPLAFALTVPPVWLSQQTGLFVVDLFFIWVHVLTAVSLCLCWFVLQRMWELPPALCRLVLVVLFLALVLGTWRQIGQREHFLLIFTYPYLLLAALRVSGGRAPAGLAGTVGAMAAFGFALKPHFLLVPALLELYRLVSVGRLRRILRAETLTLGLLLVLYAAAVVHLTPAYLDRIVPWALEVYGSYANPLLAVLLRWETALLVAAAAAYFSMMQRSAAGPLAGVFLIAAIAFFVIYLVQMKGWSYHRMPVTATAFVVLALCLTEGLRRGEAPIDLLRSAAVLVVFAWTCGWLVLQGSYKNGFFDRALPAIEAQAPRRTLHVLSSNVWQSYPLVNYARLESVSRFSTLWLLPGTVSGLADDTPELSADKRARLEAIERYAVAAVLEDLERGAPELILLDVRPEKTYFDGPFDYLSYLSREPRFAAFWKRYERVAELPGFDLYRRR
ncbi:MAG: hypothetical protein QNJ94_12520 [Alphaproteobacteria bacterium]|nr:hypothetical protein [Alphaproteobacteria bacterium]